MFGATRTFRWNDGESTSGYHGVDVDLRGARFFRWSHRQGEGRIELGAQSLEALLSDGPLIDMPDSVAGPLRAEASRQLRTRSSDA